MEMFQRWCSPWVQIWHPHLGISDTTQRVLFLWESPSRWGVTKRWLVFVPSFLDLVFCWYVLGGGLVLAKFFRFSGMVWHRDTLTRLAAVLTLRGGIQLTQCAACVATFGDVALLGSSVLNSASSRWVGLSNRGVWRIPIIRTLQDHRCISYAYPIRSYNIRILNQSLSISVCVNFEKPTTISFHMSSNVYINLNIYLSLYLHVPDSI